MTIAPSRKVGNQRVAVLPKKYKKLPNEIKKGSDISPSCDGDLDSFSQKIRAHIDTFQYEQAREVCEQALARSPEDADLHFVMGSVCLELADFAAGYTHIRQSLHLKPETTPDRFFAFAQLLSGGDALQVYEHGLSVYEQLLLAAQSETAVEVLAEMKRKVSMACGAAAELFMTDLCEEEGAEGCCEEWLERAVKIDPRNPDVFRIRADFKMCQSRPEEARASVLEACRIWTEDLQASTMGAQELPSYESRISAAKILIELNEAELWEPVVELLEQLLKEDDAVVMTWYLLSLALKMGHSIVDPESSALMDAVEAALRVACREGLLKCPELETDDELIIEILNMARELSVPLDNLDQDVTDLAEELEGVVDALEEIIENNHDFSEDENEEQ